MNRLKFMKCYLCGSMDLSKDGGVGWRKELTPKLYKLGLGVMDPCDKPSSFAQEDEYTRATVNKLKEQGRFDEVKTIMNPIAHVDLRLVDEASFLIVYIDTTIHTAGSGHEMAIALLERKPTLIVCKQGKNNIPNWWFAYVNHNFMFSSFDELLEYLNHIDKDEKVDHYNRWLFFDYNKVYGINQ